MKQAKKRIRNAVNKPVEFIQHLELLNLLPEGLNDSLKKLSFYSEKFRHCQGLISEKQNKISRTFFEAREWNQLPPELLTKNAFYFEKSEKTYLQIFNSLPKELKNYIESQLPQKIWQWGEQVLNRLSLEKESLELIVAQQRLRREFMNDFEHWKSNQKTISDDLFNNFHKLTETDELTQKQYNPERYTIYIPYTTAMLLPGIDSRLQWHSYFPLNQRKSFRGFQPYFTNDEGILIVRANGLVDIILRSKDKENGGIPIEIDRLRRCEFCYKNLIYAYKDNQIFCSSKCRSGNNARQTRNKGIALLEKTLKKAEERLSMLGKSRLTESDLIKEQRIIVERLKNQIDEERK